MSEFRNKAAKTAARKKPAPKSKISLKTADILQRRYVEILAAAADMDDENNPIYKALSRETGHKSVDIRDAVVGKGRFGRQISFADEPNGSIESTPRFRKELLEHYRITLEQNEYENLLRQVRGGNSNTMDSRMGDGLVVHRIRLPECGDCAYVGVDPLDKVIVTAYAPRLFAEIQQDARLGGGPTQERPVVGQAQTAAVNRRGRPVNVTYRKRNGGSPQQT